MQRRQLESKPEPRSVFHGAMDRREGQLGSRGRVRSDFFLPFPLFQFTASPRSLGNVLVSHDEGERVATGRRGRCEAARPPASGRPLAARGSLGVPVAAERPRPRLPAMAPQVVRSPRCPLLPPAPSALILNLFISLTRMFRGLSPLPSTREHVYRATVHRGQSPLSHAGLPTSAAGSWPRHCRVPDGLSPLQTQSCPPRPPSAPEVLSVPLFAGKGTARTSLGVLP